MADFEAGHWIIGIIIYFVFFFLIVSSIVGSKIYYGTVSGIEAEYTDPGFQDRISDFGNISKEKCSGSGGGRSMNFLGNIQCNQLDIDQSVKYACNNLSGCVWQNYTSIFGITISDAKCTGILNMTYYNIEGGVNTYCKKSPGLQNNETLCRIVKCDWINVSSFPDEFENDSPVVIYETVKFITGYRTEIGLGNWHWLFAFFFFYMPFLVFIWAIYRAISPL